MKKKVFKYIDLFAGIGGFHQAMHSVGMKCVFASEWDKHARISYEANYKEDSPWLFENDYSTSIVILPKQTQKKFLTLTYAAEDSLASRSLSHVSEEGSRIHVARCFST